MGCRARLVVLGDRTLAAAARARIEDLEQRWSRFLPRSELNRLNARSGHPTVVSDETRLLVEVALEGWSLSGGAFDPTLLGDVIRAGYERTFDDFDDFDEQAPAVVSPYRSGCGEIVLDGNTVTLPPSVGLDSGGIGKGLAADLVVAELLAAGAAGACVSLGGDLAVAGEGPGPGGAWTIDIEHAWSRRPLARIGLRSGAVATSSTLARAWVRSGEPRHHVIDPRSHAPCDSGLNHASVVSGTAWRAEVLATAVLVNGGRHPFDILGGTGAEGLAVSQEGEVCHSEGFGRFLGDASRATGRLRPV